MDSLKAICSLLPKMQVHHIVNTTGEKQKADKNATHHLYYNPEK
jgi:hypothetical protein